jgi:predicted LPLAT superfamily acyltransferase
MTDNKKHWSDSSEKIGGYYGIRLMLLFYDYGGRTVFKLLLYPVMFFYYLFSKKQRAISKDFLNQVEKVRDLKGLPYEHYSSFTHFIAFGNMLIDKINAWRGNIHLYQEAVFMEDSEEVFYAYEKESRGKILLCSHLGNVEALRAVGTKDDTRAPEVYSVFFTKNAQNFNNILKAISKEAQLNIIATDSIGPDTAIKLSEIIENKGMIAIVGDRTPVREKESCKDTSHNNEASHNSQTDSVKTKVNEPQRVCEVDFMGRKAYLPQGAFILASLLKCPVQCLFALKNEKTGKIEIYCRDLFDEVKLPRKNKDAALQEYVQKYAELLEYFTIRYPYQWFNFFDFFKK